MRIEQARQFSPRTRGCTVLSTWVNRFHLAGHDLGMHAVKPIPSASPDVSYRGYRFPKEVIAFAVWLYFRFPLSLRMVEDMLAARGIAVTYETVRR